MVQMKEERLLLQMPIHLRNAISISIIIIIALVVYVYI